MKKRLELLASAQEASQARLDSRAGDALAEQCRALCALLPDAERAVIESRGATGYAALLEGYWITASGEEEFTRQAALIAYRDALGLTRDRIEEVEQSTAREAYRLAFEPSKP